MDGKDAHALSLKVLRLSRPSLALQHPLPQSSALDFRASLSLPAGAPDEHFALTPLLTLPESFGAVHVGESFECILCANNELPPDSLRRVTSLQIAAELQTPSSAKPQPLPLQFGGRGPSPRHTQIATPAAPRSADATAGSTPSSPIKTKSNTAASSLTSSPTASRPTSIGTASDLRLLSPSVSQNEGLALGQSRQAILRCEIREEGTYQLGVVMSYNESLASGPEAGAALASGRVRSFRKLYNFAATPCLSVRTKSTVLTGYKEPDTRAQDGTNALEKERPLASRADSQEEQRPATALDELSAATRKLQIKSTTTQVPPPSRERYALECQLENLAEGYITIERLTFDATAPFAATSANWDTGHVDVPVLAPHEVTQVAFLLEAQSSATGPASFSVSPSVSGPSGAAAPTPPTKSPTTPTASAKSIPPKEMTRDGRTVLGALTIQWRSAMGQTAILSTGWLTSKRPT